MRVEPLDATLGAAVTGISLADLDDAAWAQVEAAFHEHGILVFPEQHLTGEQQKEFGSRFGCLEDINGTKGLTPITNRQADGTLRAADDPIMHVLKGNEGWHTDSSYMPVSAKVSMLSARVVPAHGGQTEWADMRAAYDALDDETKELVGGLSAYHSLKYSQGKLGFDDAPKGAYGHDVDVPPLRPLVKLHPATGRPSLFIGRHAFGIPGMDPAASESLLDGLLADACRPPRTYAHDWQVGDLVVWDNRCVLHRARPWNLDELRVMHHTRISGDPRTESATN